MKTKIISASLFFLVSICCTAGPLDSVDSAKTTTPGPRSHWRLTTRLHNQGIFTFGGHVASDNPTVDINFTYDRKKWGLLFFTCYDFYDHKTYYNFALLMVYKNFKLSEKVTITPFIGAFLEQANSIADRGSDIASILTTTVRLNQNFSVEHMSLFGNLVLEPNQRDWVNRVRLLYTGKHWDVFSSLWHNNSVFDNSSYWSTGLNVAYSRIKVADHFYLSAGVTGLVMIQTSDEAANPKKNALMFTVSMQWAH